MIPNKLHFIWLGGSEFSIVEYISIKSALTINRNHIAYLYCDVLPSGEYFKKIEKHLNIIYVPSKITIFGYKINNLAHQSDIIRLIALYLKGGIYLDLDTISVKAFDDNITDYDFVVAYQDDSKSQICNAVILSRPELPFIKIWLESYQLFRSRGEDIYWSEQSCQLPLFLIQSNEDINQDIFNLKKSYSIKCIDFEYFFSPSWKDADLFIMPYRGFKNLKAYVYHMWGNTIKKQLHHLIKHPRSQPTLFDTLSAPILSFDDHKLSSIIVNDDDIEDYQTNINNMITYYSKPSQISILARDFYQINQSISVKQNIGLFNQYLYFLKVKLHSLGINRSSYSIRKILNSFSKISK